MSTLESRLARLEEAVPRIDKNIDGIRTDIKSCVAPITLLVQQHDRDITYIKNDVEWMKPWFKRALAVGGGSGIAAGIVAIFNYFTGK